jgi:hypothetical protein
MERLNGSSSNISVLKELTDETDDLYLARNDLELDVRASKLKSLLYYVRTIIDRDLIALLYAKLVARRNPDA